MTLSGFTVDKHSPASLASVSAGSLICIRLPGTYRAEWCVPGLFIMIYLMTSSYKLHGVVRLSRSKYKYVFEWNKYTMEPLLRGQPL